MNIPPYLKEGDKVAVLCPASYIEADLTPAYDILKSWGLQPVIYDSVLAQHYQFAGEDELRTKDLQEALDNPEIKAVIAGRGGYGCVRIIDSIDFSAFRKNPKWMVGFSDVTVILSHIQQQFGVPVIHGQMVKTFLDATKESLESLKNALFGLPNHISYTFSEFPHRQGAAEAILTGGNLALLHSIIGSPSEVDYEGKILFIEDVGESLYNIDRMLWTLKRAGRLQKLKGLIVGGFTELKDYDPPFGQSFQEIIFDKVKEYDYPVAFGCPAGHIEDNRALTFGKEIVLTVDESNVNIQYKS